MGREQKAREFDEKQWSKAKINLLYEDDTNLTWEDPEKWTMDPTMRTFNVMTKKDNLMKLECYPLERIKELTIVRDID